uniref:Ig-like domain-containing protein n=1 Tax=Cyprinodon variegatus TaxID=28743 RepID=A0A3Q2D8P1_CYPVA
NKGTLFLIIFVFLHSINVVTVEPGQSVTLTCAFSRTYQSNTWLYWYKQSAGNTLNLILLQQRTTSPQYGRDFSPSKFHLTHSAERSNLTIFSTVQEDEGMYHCAQMDALESMWSGTYLSIKGSARKTSTYAVVQHSAVNDHPADPETLQCSLLSDSENKTCAGEPTVFWFRSTSETSFPDIIYKDAKRSYNCETRSDTQKRCFYNFSKNINSSDSGTYHCAVATCGQILFANEIHIKKGMICIYLQRCSTKWTQSLNSERTTVCLQIGSYFCQIICHDRRT